MNCRICATSLGDFVDADWLCYECRLDSFIEADLDLISNFFNNEKQIVDDDSCVTLTSLFRSLKDAVDKKLVYLNSNRFKVRQEANSNRVQVEAMKSSLTSLKDFVKMCETHFGMKI